VKHFETPETGYLNDATRRIGELFIFFTGIFPVKFSLKARFLIFLSLQEGPFYTCFIEKFIKGTLLCAFQIRNC